MDLRVGVETGRLEAGFDHAQTAERKNRTLERFVGLQADDDFIVAVDISGLVRQHRRRIFRIDGEHALLALFLEVRLELCPDRFRALRGPGKKFLVACVRGDVANDEIADIDGSRPIASPETAPAILILRFSLKSRTPFHGISPKISNSLFFCTRTSTQRAVWQC